MHAAWEMRENEWEGMNERERSKGRRDGQVRKLKWSKPRYK